MGIKLKYCERRVVNGIERAYDGSLEVGKLHEFVRPVEGGVEYCLFAELTEDNEGRLVGKLESREVIEPIAAPSICLGNPSSDLYVRGMNIWEGKAA